MIHVSHSRRELIDIVEIYELYLISPLMNYKSQTKQELSFNLWSVISNDDLYIPEDNKYMFFEDVDEIRLYLVKESPNKIITEDISLEIHDKVKNIVYYCTKCGYEIPMSNFKNLKDIIKAANYIRIYGNLPNVRRAIKLINKDSKIKDKFELIMSRKVARTLLEKDRIKQSTTPKFKVKKGSEFTVVFE